MYYIATRVAHFLVSEFPGRKTGKMTDFLPENTRKTKKTSIAVSSGGARS